jgi:hypothetical protein
MATVLELLGDTPPAPGGPENTDSAFVKGLRSGFTGLQSQLASAAGGAGEALGATDFARNRYAQAEDLSRQAAEQAPPVRSYKDVTDLKTGFDYVTGLVGQSIPTSAAAVGGALLTRGRPIGAAAPLTVAETGDVIQRQQADPVTAALPASERLPAAVAGGAVAAGLQTVAPTIVARQIAGRTARTAAGLTGPQIAARGAGTAGIEAGAEAGAEATKQGTLVATNPNAQFDPEAIKEAAVAGAAAGGAMAVPGGVAEAAHGSVARAGDTLGDLARRGVAKIEERGKAALETARTGLFKRVSDDPARAVADDALLDPLPEGADPNEHVAQSDAKATEWATTKLKGWLEDADIAPEMKAKATDLLAKVSDPAARAEVAAMDLGRKATKQATDFYEHMTKGDAAQNVLGKVNDAVQSVRAHVEEFSTKTVPQRAKETRAAVERLLKDNDLTDEARTRLQAAYDNAGDAAQQAWVATVKKASEFKDTLTSSANSLADSIWKPVKKSEDFSGVRAVIARELIPAIQSKNKWLVEDATAMERVSDAVRMFVNKAMKGEKPHNDSKAMAYLQDLLGDDAVPVLDRVFNAIQPGTDGREAWYDTLQAMDEKLASRNAMASVVSDALVDKSVDVNDAVEVLRRYARGEHIKGLEGSERVVREKLLRRELEAAFGKNTDKVLDAFNKEYEDSRAATKLDSQTSTQGEDGDLESAQDDAAKSGVVEQTLSETDLEYEPPRVYRGKDKAPVLTPEAHKRKFGDSPSQHDRLMERARKDNPTRSIAFLSASQFEKTYGEKLAIPEGSDPNDYGVVVAEGQQQEARLTEDEAERLKLDSGYSRSASRIATDNKDVVLDAYKITQQTIKRMPYIEGESADRRMARAFFEGLASAMIHFGVVPDVKDATVVAVRNGKKITYGDIKHYRGSGEYSETARKDLDSEIADTQRLLAKATGDKREALKEKLELLRKKQFGRDARDGKAGPVSDLERLKNDLQVYEIDPEGNIHLAAMEHEIKDTIDPETKKMEAAAFTGKGKPMMDTGLARRPSGEGAATKRKGDEPAKPAAEAEHAPARERSIEDDAKDLVAGASNFEQIIERYTGTRDVEGGQAILADGSTANYAVTTSYKSGTVKGEPLNPMKVRALISTINDTKVKNKRELRNANEAVDRLNKALAEALKKSPDVGYALQVKSLESVDATHESPDARRAKIEEHIEKVLGNKVKVEWDKLMHAGQFEFTPGKGKVDPKLVIRLSVHSLNPSGAAYHESLHAFFQMLRDQGNHDVMKVLYRAADSAHVMNQLRQKLRNEPDALKQALNDREERVAYMYQFWAKKMLNLGPETKGVLKRIKEFIMKTLGMWTNDQRAEHIMEYFHKGEFAPHIGDANAVTLATMEPGTNKHVEALKRLIEPVKKIEMAVLGTGAERMRDTDNPALVRIADLIAPATGQTSDDVGFIQAQKNAHVERMNLLAKRLRGMSEDTLNAAHRALQTGAKRGLPTEVQAARDAVREYLDEMFDYMSAAGVKVRDLGYKDDYFPRVYDRDFIAKHEEEFVTMLEAKGIEDAREVMGRIMASEGAPDMEMPGMQHLKERKIEDVDPKWLEKNLLTVLNNYTMQATRRAEWARRFAPDNSGMRALLKEAKEKHGATQEEVDVAMDFIRGVDGTLGDDIKPWQRRIFGNLIVYQNIRLLPLAIFSTFVDPMGIAVRGGTMGEAFKAFKRGVMEIPRGFKKDKSKDEWYELAESIGTVDDLSLVHTLGTSYTQGMVSENARKLNDTLFKWNMVEQFTTSMRVAATESAVRFIKRHRGDYSPHSERWLAELGLKSSDVIVNGDRPLIHVQEFIDNGMTKDQAVLASAKMKMAINRWVDGAILRPNAADKPIWMNDPHYALIAHLKQFVYAFQNTILKRVAHEAEHGNYGPAIALASYVPIMMAADFIKGLIQGGGEQPQWKKNWGFKEYLGSAIERAGLYGVGQFAVDLRQGIDRDGMLGVASAFGPTFEQLADAIKVVGGKAQFEPFALRSLPANALYIHSLKADSTDPDFVR